MKRKLTKQDCTAIFEKLVKIIDSKIITDDFDKAGIMNVKRLIGSGGFIEAGFEKFKGGKISMYVHVHLPKKLDDIMVAQKVLTEIVTAYPDIEVYYNGNFTRDYNNGKDYCPTTHKVLRLFNTKGFETVINNELDVLTGVKKYNHLNKISSIDYDFIFQQL